ncbi:histidine phosphatase family protein [Cellulomonas carbonis]|uniref:Phosphoglycerate mutase n=1 Tax=Cellulomonas carbonis T26 TaxID=947969 RepID=A0A0A0BN85_9CELL|nr:histidine phosphatase family protein [Cellulomonas carbonis]KGM09426.1 phosphoglycerate mutase [Cellulomonas carbonis T26]GGB94965.1 hypothetical protein GCM10010972_04600 [Cellulomonas carbonis]
MSALLYLVRHGETDWNRERRLQGWIDVPLNDVGRAQAEETASRFARRPVDTVVVSPLSRARESGAIIASRLGLALPTVDSGLKERSYGVTEGLTHAEVAARFPPPQQVPGRETREQVLERAVAALGRIATRSDGGTAVVVTHGALIRAVVTEVAPGVADTLDVPIANGSVHSFAWDAGCGRGRLIRFDDPVDLELEELDAEALRLAELSTSVPR